MDALTSFLKGIVAEAMGSLAGKLFLDKETYRSLNTSPWIPATARRKSTPSWCRDTASLWSRRKNYQGRIFGHERQAEWTRSLPARSSSSRIHCGRTAGDSTRNPSPEEGNAPKYASLAYSWHIRQMRASRSACNVEARVAGRDDPSPSRGCAMGCAVSRISRHGVRPRLPTPGPRLGFWQHLKISWSCAILSCIEPPCPMF